MPEFKIRISPLAVVVAALVIAEIVIAIMCLSLPWGKAASSGTDIRFGLVGLLPWFAFIPVLLQIGYLVVDAGVLQTLYMVANFLIGGFIIFVQAISYLKYSSFEFGFYLVFVLGGLVILTGIVCAVEKGVYTRMEASGHTREIPVTFG